MNPVVRFSSMNYEEREFFLGQGIDWTIGQSGALVQGDREIVWSMVG